MKRSLLLCVFLAFTIGCNAHFVSDRKPNNIPWGGGAFASANHQVLDLGFMRLQGKGVQNYERGMSFQFPSIGIYGGNDHFSLGLLIGFTLYYRKEGYLYSEKPQLKPEEQKPQDVKALVKKDEATPKQKQ
ncbi:hypothetical protein [Candidatus Uabimicrobium amorphum]|uniref:Lipoprotein n=1 Tax=Uabimicrobium amorphum TaxID=2596890 RepID=A0A5S9ITG2_UABAM|nr:hypothetical protein [Candidatus Uabimicrobium amorphum]BBM87838.1 hypothetical protein UABAM_06253 [Candidatus Uabimicrobium amorphum]